MPIGWDNWARPDTDISTPIPQTNIAAPNDVQSRRYAAYGRNIAIPGLEYAYSACYNAMDPYRGDETYGGDAFQYIPTETQMGAAIALRNMASAGEMPVQGNDPTMTQLLQGIYQRTSQFWQDIRKASGTGW